MEMDVLLIRARSERADLDEVGRSFFAAKFTPEETNRFFSELLKDGKYEALARIVKCGFINKYYGDKDYLSSSSGGLSLNERYFDLFMEMSKEAGVAMELVYPMVFAVYDAPAGSVLREWVRPVDLFLVKSAYDDFDGTMSIVERYDSSYMGYLTLLKADYKKTVAIIIDILLYGKGFKKTKLRKILIDTKTDIVQEIIPLYESSYNKQKEAIVRLLLLYKNDSRVDEFIDFLADTEKSITIQWLIDRDRNPKKVQDFAGMEKYVTDESGRLVLNPDEGKPFYVEITPQWTFFTKARGRRVTAAVKKLRKDMKIRKEKLFEMMITGESMTKDFFCERVLGDPLFAALASGLFFSVHNGKFLTDVIIVHDGQVLDLENRPVEIAHDEVRVLHAAELGFKYQYLRQLNVDQPFDQIKRDVYFPSDSDFSYKCVNRLSGTLIKSSVLKKKISEQKFKVLSRDIDGKCDKAGKVLGNVMCVLEFAETDFKDENKLTALGEVKFYRYKDIIKLSGQQYTDGVKPLPLEELPLRHFSEFLRSVYLVAGV